MQKRRHAISPVFDDKFADASPDPAGLKTHRYPKPRQDRPMS